MKQNANFFIIPNHIFEYKLRSTVFLVYSYLVRCSNKTKGNTCFPSWNTIAKECGISKSTVRSSIRFLEQVGLVSTIARYDNHRQTSNLYTMMEVKKESGIGVNNAPSSGQTLLPPPVNSAYKQDELNNTNSNNQSVNNKDRLIFILENAEVDLIPDRYLAGLIESTITQLFFCKELEINGAVIPREQIQKQLERIDYSIILTFIKSIQNYSTKATAPIKYLMVCLYNLIDGFSLQLEQDLPTRL